MAINYIINQSGTIGTVLMAGTHNLTGTLVATLFLILMVLVVIAIMFGVPLEITAIIVLPFCFAVGAYDTNFMIPIVAIVIYLSMIIAKNWIFR